MSSIVIIVYINFNVYATEFPYKQLIESPTFRRMKEKQVYDYFNMCNIGPKVLITYIGIFRADSFVLLLD